jgi:hypothetical protein
MIICTNVGYSSEIDINNAENNTIHIIVDTKVFIDLFDPKIK